MAVMRTEIPVAYKTTILRTIVLALREVFTSEYPDSDFANLNITTEYPLTEIEYPAIVVSYQESTINQAGVGHREYFPDPVGAFREWNHRRFEGTLEFSVHALSPLDRDVLSDALIEVLSFGKLDPLQNNFFIRVYGAESVDVGVLGLLHQISLNTDIIEAMGESNAIAPWNPEDALVYTNGYSMACHGGFYNTVRNTAGLGYVEQSIIIPTFDVHALEDEDPANQWSLIFDYHDDGAVVGKGVISAAQVGNDEGTVIGEGIVSAATSFIPAPAPDNFIVQSAVIPDDGIADNSVTLTWPIPTIAGNHLFMAVAVRGSLNIFNGVSLTAPAGWTLYNPPHGVESGPGPGIFVFYKLASGSESGSHVLNFTDQSFIGELPIRTSCAIFEVNADVVGAVSTVADVQSTTTQFKSGYDPTNPSGGGILFSGSGVHQTGAFALAFATTPGQVSTSWHIEDNDATVRDDGWIQFLTNSAIHLDTESPSLVCIGQPDTTQSAASSTHTQDLRLYNGDGLYNFGNQFPAAVWFRFGP